MTPPIHSKCCPKCWVTEISTGNHDGTEYAPVSEPFCSHPYCPCHQQQESATEVNCGCECHSEFTYLSHGKCCFVLKPVFDHPKTPQEGGISLGSAAQWAKTEQKKIAIVPSPRIDWCGDCQMEHGYECPKPTESSWADEFDRQFDYLNARHTNEQWDDLKAFIRTEKEKSYLQGRQDEIDVRNQSGPTIATLEHNAREAGILEGRKRAVEKIRHMLLWSKGTVEGTRDDIIAKLEAASQEHLDANKEI